MGRSFNRGFEALEGRQMLAVTVSNFQVSDAVVAAGQALTLSVQAAATSPDTSIRAGTFFNDVNNNGRWDAGIDVDLGADFVGSSGTYSRTITVPNTWTGTIHLVADAVSLEGTWAGTRATQTVRTNPRPVVTSFNTSVTTFTVGNPLDLTSVVSDDTSVRAVTWFIDRDLNGVWTSGLDTSLSTSFSPVTGSTYAATVTPDSSWPRNVQIVCDVQDNDLDWASVTVDSTVTQIASTRPAVTNMTAVRKYASRGAGAVQLSVDASDNSAVLLATYYIDLDGSASWTPFVDQDLGQKYASLQSGTYVLNVTTDFAGKASLQFASDAQDFDGLYASSRATTTLTNDTMTVTNFVAALTSTGGGNNQFSVSISGLASTAFGRSGAVSTEFAIFVDANNNGLYDAGTDYFVGSAAGPTTRGTESTAVSNVLIPTAYGTSPQLGVFIAQVAGPNEYSTVRMASIRADLTTNLPAVTAVTATAGSLGTFAVPGSAFTIAADWAAPAGGSVITFFFDKNSNGRWDAGIDIDLGFNTVTGTSGTSNFSGTLTNAMVGYGQFAAAVKDVSARGNDSWSAPRTQTTTQIFRAPTVSNPTSPVGVAGSPVVVDFDATDDFGIRAATGFIDINGNGLFDSGTDSTTVGTAYSPLSGSTTSGRWRLVIQTAGLSAGTYTIYVAATDFYQGDSTAAGGATNGLWSSRLAITLTLV